MHDEIQTSLDEIFGVPPQMKLNPPTADLVEKSTHCLGRQMCAFFCEETRKRCVNRGKNEEKVRNFPLPINIHIIYVYRKILPKSKNYLCRPI